MRHTIAQLAYLAGLLDGEGCITAVARKSVGRGNSYRTDVTIANTCKKVTDWLLKNFGGAVYTRTFKETRYKTAYNWYMDPKEILSLLPKVIPFLVVKKSQAELMLEFRNLIQEHNLQLSKKVVDKRRRIANRFRKLNKKGKK